MYLIAWHAQQRSQGKKTALDEKFDKKRKRNVEKSQEKSNSNQSTSQVTYNTQIPHMSYIPTPALSLPINNALIQNNLIQSSGLNQINSSPSFYQNLMMYSQDDLQPNNSLLWNTSNSNNNKVTGVNNFHVNGNYINFNNNSEDNHSDNNHNNNKFNNTNNNNRNNHIHVHSNTISKTSGNSTSADSNDNISSKNGNNNGLNKNNNVVTATTKSNNSSNNNNNNELSSSINNDSSNKQNRINNSSGNNSNDIVNENNKNNDADNHNIISENKTNNNDINKYNNNSNDKYNNNNENKNNTSNGFVNNSNSGSKSNSHNDNHCQINNSINNNNNKNNNNNNNNHNNNSNNNNDKSNNSNNSNNNSNNNSSDSNNNNNNLSTNNQLGLLGQFNASSPLKDNKYVVSMLARHPLLNVSNQMSSLLQSNSQNTNLAYQQNLQQSLLKPTITHYDGQVAVRPPSTPIQNSLNTTTTTASSFPMIIDQNPADLVQTLFQPIVQLPNPVNMPSNYADSTNTIMNSHPAFTSYSNPNPLSLTPHLFTNSQLISPTSVRNLSINRVRPNTVNYINNRNRKKLKR